MACSMPLHWAGRDCLRLAVVFPGLAVRPAGTAGRCADFAAPVALGCDGDADPSAAVDYASILRMDRRGPGAAGTGTLATGECQYRLPRTDGGLDGGPDTVHDDPYHAGPYGTATGGRAGRNADLRADTGQRLPARSHGAGLGNRAGAGDAAGGVVLDARFCQL